MTTALPPLAQLLAQWRLDALGLAFAIPTVVLVLVAAGVPLTAYTPVESPTGVT